MVGNFEAEAAKLSQALNRFEGQQQMQQKHKLAAKQGGGLYGLNERDEWLHEGYVDDASGV